MPGNRFAPTPRYAMAPEDEGGAGKRASAPRAAEIGSGAPDGAAPAGASGGNAGGVQAEAAAAGAPGADGAPPPRNGAPPSEPKSVPDERIPDKGSADKGVPDKSAPEKGFPLKGFPDTWRQDLAGSDKAFRKTLDRFDSPAALAKAYRELTARLSSGELRSTKPPPDTATPEQVAAWRAEHGLPESAAAYVDGLALGDGTVTGEAEKALLASFADQAMKGHWTAAQYNQAVGWYFDLQDRMAAQRDHADGTSSTRQRAS